MGEIVNITLDNYEAEVVLSDKLVILDFTATWCGPCKRLAPILEEIATLNSDRVKLAKVDVDHARDIALQYRITSVPTVVYVKGGVELKRFFGMRAKPAVKADLDELLG